MLWVRTEDGTPARGYEPSDLAAGAHALGAETAISLREDGPFERLAVAVARDSAVRDALARSIDVPSVRSFARLRFVLLAIAAAPLLMVVELDRELVTAHVGSAAALVGDVLAGAYVTWELTRRTPRMPGVAAAALAAVAVRFALVATRLCGRGVHAAVWAAGTLAAIAALGVLARAPSPARVALELLDKLGVAAADARAAREERAATPKAVAAAVVAAIGLPATLLALRHAGVDVWAQAGAFVAYALVVPEIVRRRADPANGAFARVAPARALFAIAAGLTLAAALLHGAHWFFDAGHELARCTGKLDAETKRLFLREAAETSSSVARVRASGALVAMTAVVMPLAEERVYRGLLMDVLARKYGAAYGLFASAVVFGFAHLGLYEVALYQTVLLGVAFGVAYAEGGLVAAFVVHAAWNLLVLA